MVYINLCKTIVMLKSIFPADKFCQILNKKLDEIIVDTNKRQQAYELFINLSEDNIEETAKIMEELDKFD